jgi:hypothetical protein
MTGVEATKLTTFDDVLGDLAIGTGIRRKRWDTDTVLFYHYKTGDFIRINNYIESKTITRTIPLAIEDLVADDWEVVEGELIVSVDYEYANGKD